MRPFPRIRTSARIGLVHGKVLPPAGLALFATRYLEEADAYADRIILLRHGQKIADGTASEIKAMSAGRVIASRRSPVPTAQRPG